MYVKSNRKSWLGRSINTTQALPSHRKIVSVDQLVSPTPGLVSQITVILSTNRYKYSTVFFDHLSIYSYMYLHQTASDEYTLEGKHAFEIMSASHVMIINQYHSSNGIFRANVWVQYFQETANPQRTTHDGVDDHPTKGLVEIRIR